MFKIYGERKEFWQWDIGQKLIVSDKVCSEVHFCNGTSDKSLVCEVAEDNGLRTVSVPNILLQTAKTIKAYAYVCGEDEQYYTEHAQVFIVLPRTKPDDYVYTETEVKRFDVLEKRVLDLINSVEKTVVNPPQISKETRTWLVWDTIAGEYVDSGIIAEGQDGTPGFSPTIAEEAIDGGHRLTITTADKVTVLDIRDGAPGVGIASVKQTVVSDADGGENEVTVTLTNGNKETFVVRNGRKGDPGYTPQKGVDYTDGAPGKPGEDYVLTEADKEEIAGLLKDDIDTSVEAALTEAKESGEFKGEPGDDYILTETDKEEIAAMADTTVPNAATVNDANELVMQRAEGDVVTELFKTALPAGGGSGIEVSGAAVGQTIKIAEVDENGVPTAWEAVDFPGERWFGVVTTEEVLTVELDLPEVKFSDYFDVFVRVYVPPMSYNTAGPKSTLKVYEAVAEYILQSNSSNFGYLDFRIGFKNGSAYGRGYAIQAGLVGAGTYTIYKRYYNISNRKVSLTAKDEYYFPVGTSLAYAIIKHDNGGIS